MIRKSSLAKGMFSTEISLAKGILSKTGAAHAVKIFSEYPPGNLTTWVPPLPWGNVNMTAGLILGLHPANERRCYFVTMSLIGCVQAWTWPCDR